MTEEFKIFFIFIIGLVSSYLGAFVTWGVSTLSIAMMTALGLTPQLASITFKLGKIWNGIALITEYHKAKLLRKEYVIWLSIASFIGAVMGSFFIVQIPSIVIYSVSGTSMLVLLYIDITKSHKKQNTPKEVNLSTPRRFWGYVLELIATTLANLSPAASGAWFYYIRTFVFRLSPLESKAIGSFVSIPWFIGTFIGILLAGYYNVAYGIALAVGMYIWAHHGAKKSLQISEEKLRNFIRIFILISSFYFLYLAYNSWQ